MAIKLDTCGARSDHGPENPPKCWACLARPARIGFEQVHDVLRVLAALRSEAVERAGNSALEHREREREYHREYHRERYANDPEYRERELREYHRRRWATDPEFRERDRKRAAICQRPRAPEAGAGVGSGSVYGPRVPGAAYGSLAREYHRERYANDPESPGYAGAGSGIGSGIGSDTPTPSSGSGLLKRLRERTPAAKKPRPVHEPGCDAIIPPEARADKLYCTKACGNRQRRKGEATWIEREAA